MDPQPAKNIPGVLDDSDYKKMNLYDENEDEINQGMKHLKLDEVPLVDSEDEQVEDDYKKI